MTRANVTLIGANRSVLTHSCGRKREGEIGLPAESIASCLIACTYLIQALRQQGAGLQILNSHFHSWSEYAGVYCHGNWPVSRSNPFSSLKVESDGSLSLASLKWIMWYEVSTDYLYVCIYVREMCVCVCCSSCSISNAMYVSSCKCKKKYVHSFCFALVYRQHTVWYIYEIQNTFWEIKHPAPISIIDPSVLNSPLTKMEKGKLETKN